MDPENDQEKRQNGYNDICAQNVWMWDHFSFIIIMVEYKQKLRVLLLGEGNFSYALARVKYFIEQSPTTTSL